MTSEEKDELLDRYVAGQPMSVDEEARINQLLDTDPGFRTEYRLRQELFEAGKRERRVAWEARQRVQPRPVERTVFPMRWAAAASVVLLLSLGLLWWTRTTNSQPRILMDQAPLFEQRDTQLGLAGSDSSAVGTITWVVTEADEDQYEFSQPDTLRIFSTDPDQWKDQTWRIIRLSEVRYQLRVGSKTYPLEQGRNLRLPLEPKK